MTKSRIRIKTKVLKGYNSISADYAKTRERSWPAGAGISAWLADYIQDDMRILDIGCGAGPLVEFLHQTGRHIDYIGLDNSTALLAQARARFGNKYHNITCVWREADMDDLVALSDLGNDFDIVCLIASLHHIPSSRARSQVLAQVARLLKPAGYICVTNWYIWIYKFWQKYHLFHQACLHPWRVLLQCDVFIPWKNQAGVVITQRYIHGFGQNELVNLVKKNGFEIIQNQLYSKEPQSSVATSICVVAKKC